MKTAITIIFIVLNIFSLKAQETPNQVSLNTLKFENIRVYNKFIDKEFTLYTKQENIANFIDVTKTRARPAPGSIVNIPFFTFSDNEYFYTVYSEYFVYSYQGWNGDVYVNSDDIFITYIEPGEEIVLTILYNDEKIILNKEITPFELKKYFEQSYKSFQDNNNIFKRFSLHVIKDNKSTYLDLEFKNDHFVAIRLWDKGGL